MDIISLRYNILKCIVIRDASFFGNFCMNFRVTFDFKDENRFLKARSDCIPKANPKSVLKQ